MVASSGRLTPFQAKHAVLYALEVTAKDLNGDVETVQCQFCVHRGREACDNPQSKRRRTDNVMLWSRPFRPELYRLHHENQHPLAWADYQQTTPQEKKTFFEKDKRESIDTYVEFKKEYLTFRIRGPIVDVLIADMFFNPEEDEEDDDSSPISKANALKLFHPEPDGSYTVTISNPLRYNLALDHTSAGLSFRQTAKVITQHRNRTKNPKLIGLSDHMVGQYVRTLVAANLNAISAVIARYSVWCFSLAADSSTHFGVSFMDIRIRVNVSGRLYNLHLVVVPFFERHTASNIFEHIVKLLDVVLDCWRDKLVSVSSDGENTMTGRHSGVVTCLENAATHKVLRIWCVPHQIDLVIKSITKALDQQQFYKITHAFSVHLRSQANLITEMKSKCPKDTTRWLAFGTMLEWILDHRLRLLEHVRSKRPVQAPSDSWWIFAAAVSPFYNACNVVMTALQSPQLVVSQQRTEIRNLILNLGDNLDIRMSGTDNSFADLDPSLYVIENLFWVNLSSVEAIIHDQVNSSSTINCSDRYRRVHGLETYS
jgi:hypothetical protein